jgi:hypothetical protein
MPERGTYVSLHDLKAAIGETMTTNDASLLAAAEDASRYVDQHCARKFYVQTATRYYTARNPCVIDVDDILAVTTLKTDSDGDRVYDETWAVTDYDLTAGDDFNTYPFWRISRTPDGAYTFPRYARGVEITGSWGYGNGESASPWMATGITITVGTTTGTAVTASSASNPFSAGQTILVGTEQMYLTAVVGTALTAERGVNGSTAAIQAAAAASIAQYPRNIIRATLRIAQRANALEGAPFGVRGSADMGTLEVTSRMDPDILHWLAPFRHLTVG